MYTIISTIARGIGQVMFQGNALSGVLMLTGIAVNSWQLALLALLGNILSTGTAVATGYDRADIRHGLYGFNGTLVGIAVGVFLDISVAALLLLAAGAVLSTWVAHAFSRQNRLPGLTAPFVLTVWLVLAVCHAWFAGLLPAVPSAGVPVPAAGAAEVFCLNVGQVMFQADIFSGMLFLLAILVNSRVNAAYAVLGAALPLAVMCIPSLGQGAWVTGMAGYNGVLCAIALGDKSVRGAVLAVVAVVLSVLLQLVGMRAGLITLTAPFVVSVWVVTLAASRFK